MLYTRTVYYYIVIFLPVFIFFVVFTSGTVVNHVTDMTGKRVSIAIFQNKPISIPPHPSAKKLSFYWKTRVFFKTDMFPLSKFIFEMSNYAILYGLWKLSSTNLLSVAPSGFHGFLSRVLHLLSSHIWELWENIVYSQQKDVTFAKVWHRFPFFSAHFAFTLVIFVWS